MTKNSIADILTLIRNADMNGKRTVQVPRTRISEIIVKILVATGLVENVRKHRESKKDFYVFTLRYRRNRKRSYQNLSRPGLRIYSNYQEIPRVLGEMGIVILSTSRGIMTDREARLERIGGEVIIYDNFIIILQISEFDEKLRYIIVNGVEKKQISNITLDTLVNV